MCCIKRVNKSDTLTPTPPIHTSLLTFNEHLLKLKRYSVLYTKKKIEKNKTKQTTY